MAASLQPLDTGRMTRKLFHGNHLEPTPSAWRVRARTERLSPRPVILHRRPAPCRTSSLPLFAHVSREALDWRRCGHLRTAAKRKKRSLSGRPGEMAQSTQCRPSRLGLLRAEKARRCHSKADGGMLVDRRGQAISGVDLDHSVLRRTGYAYLDMGWRRGGREWPRRERLRRSWSRTSSATVGSRPRMKSARLRGFEGAAQRPHRYGDRATATGGSSSAPATERWSSSAAWSILRSAVEVQKGLARAQCRSFRRKERIEVRIGVHLGDVVEEADGDLMGDGVNVAARLQAICRARWCLSFRRRLRTGARQDAGDVVRRPSARPEEHSPVVRAYALLGRGQIARRRQMQPAPPDLLAGAPGLFS